MTKRKELTDSEKLHILERLTQTPRPSQELVAAETHHRKEKIGGVLKEFNSMAWKEAQALCGNDERVLGLRKDYLERKAIEAERIGGLAQPSTVEEIVIGEQRKQLLLKHQDDLRAVAGRWKSEVWLPPPWRWDVANLKHVFYVDSKNNRTGYKLPEELVSGEESRGHGRAFIGSQRSVTWDVLESGSIVLKAPVEGEPLFDHLKAHTEKSSAWGLFAEWKEKGGTYIQLCSWLLARIEQDTKKAIEAKSELSWWSIYHDAFCVKDTQYRCGGCGTENPYAFACPICGGKFSQEEEIILHIGNSHPQADPKAWLLPQCQTCFMPLGWLRPLLKGYRLASENSQSSPIAIDGWSNIEESVEIEHFESYIRGHAALRDKYRGHDLVETILEAEKEVKEVQVHLIGEVTSLSEQKVFHGKCPACPD